MPPCCRTDKYTNEKPWRSINQQIRIDHGNVLRRVEPGVRGGEDDDSQTRTLKPIRYGEKGVCKKERRKIKSIAQAKKDDGEWRRR